MSGSRRLVVIAPDSFKGTIRARDAAAALAEGWSQVRPRDRVLRRPMADGGEGTMDAVAAAFADAVRHPVSVSGPGGGEVQSSWLRLPAAPGRPATGVVELATTSGIELLGDTGLRPLDAGTRGFGEAMRAALDAGVTRLVLAIGSSASSDGGAGLLQALGARVVDGTGHDIVPGARGLATAVGIEWAGLAAVPRDGALALVDVDAPLLGPLGAARVFGPQKGATPDEVRTIEAALARWQGLVGADPAVRGAGAAGGTGYGLLAWGASLRSGADTVARLIGLDDALVGADLVVTGEGAFDVSSVRGKAPGRVLDAARAAGVPVAIVAGRVRSRSDAARTVDLTDLAGGAEEAMGDPARWLREAGRRLASVDE